MNISELNCNGCYRCCTTPDANNTNRTPIMESDRKKEFNVPEYIKHLDNGCVGCKYLGDDGLCSQYEKRPLICRTYPLYPFLDESNDPKLLVATYKCHIGQMISEKVAEGDQEMIDSIKQKFNELDYNNMYFKYDEVKKLMEDFSKYRSLTILNINPYEL